MPVYPELVIAPGEPGALLLEPYGYEFRGLLFGTGTDFVTEKVEGLLAMPAVSLDEEEKSYDHGTFPGIPTMEGRRISFDMKIKGSAGFDIEEKLSVCRKTFQLPRIRNGRISEPFVFWRPGQPKKFCLARCTRRDFNSEFETARGLAEGSVELFANDPLIYSLEEQSASFSLVDAAAAGSTIINQAGDHPDGAWPLITITGPATDPVITNEDDDFRAIRLTLVLGPADEAVIDVEKEIMWVNDVRDSDAISSDNEWWALLPGDNTINYNRSAGNATSTITFDYRNVWQ